MLLAVSILSCVPAAADSGSTIVLREVSQVETPEICLGDVADLAAVDENTRQELAEIPLGSSPAFGSVRSFSRNQVREAIGTAAGFGRNFIIKGPSIIQVKLRGRTVEPDEILPVIRNYLVDELRWKDAEIEVRSIGNLHGVEVPRGKITFRIPQKISSSSYHHLLLPVEAASEGRPVRTFWVTADVCVRARILKAAIRIPFGKILSRDDVTEALAEITGPRAGYIQDHEDAVGRELRRTLSPGDPLTRESLADPVLVRSGQTVRLLLEKGRVSLSALARAEQNGKLGQVIKVRNLDFARPVKALVVGRAEVRIP